MRSRIAWFKYRPSHPAEAGELAPCLTRVARALSLSAAEAKAGHRFAACLLIVHRGRLGVPRPRRFICIQAITGGSGHGPTPWVRWRQRWLPSEPVAGVFSGMRSVTQSFAGPERAVALRKQDPIRPMVVAGGAAARCVRGYSGLSTVTPTPLEGLSGTRPARATSRLRAVRRRGFRIREIVKWLIAFVRVNSVAADVQHASEEHSDGCMFKVSWIAPP